MSNLDPTQAPLDLAAEEAEKLLRAAHVARLRGDRPAAEDRVRQALQMKPDDPEAHAILGEMLLESGEAQAAIDELKRAMELKPGVVRYEAGYAKATLAVAEAERKKAMALSLATGARAPQSARNPTLATLASLFIPGGGQLYNGQLGKAVFFLLLVLVTAAISIGFSISQAHRFGSSDATAIVDRITSGDDESGPSGGSGLPSLKDFTKAISPIGMVFALISLIAWVWNFIDAGVVANRLNREESAKTGWEV